MATLKITEMCSVKVIVPASVCLWQHPSISLPPVIHCEKCSHFRELSGNLYFETVTQQLSPRDRKQPLLCWRRARGCRRRWAGEQRRGDYRRSSPCHRRHNAGRKFSREERGGEEDCHSGPRRPAPWLTNERQKVSSALPGPLTILQMHHFSFFFFFFMPREGAVTSVSLFLHLPSQSFFISHTPSGQYVQLPKPLIAPLLYAHSPTHLKWQFMRSSLSLLKCFLLFFFFFFEGCFTIIPYFFFLSGQPWWISLPVLNIQFVSPVGEKKTVFAATSIFRIPGKWLSDFYLNSHKYTAATSNCFPTVITSRIM